MILQFSLAEYTMQSGADGLMEGNQCFDGIWGGAGEGPWAGEGRKDTRKVQLIKEILGQ